MTAPPRGTWLDHWPFFVIALGAVVALGLIAGRIAYKPFNTPSTAMAPTLALGDYFLVSQFAYAGAPPQRGDVVVFHLPDGVAYLKRVIGLPGEHVQMRDGIVYIDGRAARLRRISNYAESCDDGSVCPVPQYEETLPGGRTHCVLDRGDTRLDHTPVYVVPPDSYFVLGDNRDNSDDSRLNLGFVRRDAILGRAAFAYFSDDKPVWRDVR